MSTLAKACFAILQCIGAEGFNPAYLHEVTIVPGRVDYKWDGTWDSYVGDKIRACIVPDNLVPNKELKCEFHNDPDKEWSDPLK